MVPEKVNDERVVSTALVGSEEESNVVCLASKVLEDSPTVHGSLSVFVGAWVMPEKVA